MKPQFLIILIVGIVSGMPQEESLSENQVTKTKTKPCEKARDEFPNKCLMNDPMENSKFVLRAYQEVFGDKNLEKLDEYFADDYIQHNPLAYDGKEGLKQLIQSLPDPPQQIDFKRISATDDLVWTHNQLVFYGQKYAAVDIFRVKCGIIVEHWDVLQNMNLTMPSRNPQPFF